jgi:hypothetical protein
MASSDDIIWEHLVEHHDADNARMPNTERERRIRPLTAGVSAGGLAAAAAAAVLVFSGTSGTSPAFAVSRHGGVVAVKINRTSGIAGANRKLAAMGIHERVSVQSTRETCLSRLSSQQLSYLSSHSTATTLPGGRTVILTPKPGPHTVFKAVGNTGAATRAWVTRVRVPCA